MRETGASTGTGGVDVVAHALNRSVAPATLKYLLIKIIWKLKIVNQGYYYFILEIAVILFSAP
jgi:hypothetical protein